MEIYQVDAFTDTPFKGNPAAVCLLSKEKDDNWMQDVAGEMNLSETAFLFRKGDGFNLRWFTPIHEEELCGHATLASTHILFETELVQEDEEIKYFTKSGILTARKQGKWIELNFPIEEEHKVKSPELIVKALGVEPSYVGKNRLDYLVEVESEEVVKNLKPDFNLINKLDTRGVIVTSKSHAKDFDFISRFFAPGVGIDEDPVTGSAHCCLAPYWSEKLKKNQFFAYQASKRGGVIKVRIDGERVILGGQAVTVLQGELLK